MEGKVRRKRSMTAGRDKTVKEKREVGKSRKKSKKKWRGRQLPDSSSPPTQLEVLRPTFTEITALFHLFLIMR